MNINSIAVLLGCAGLLIGGAGIVAQGNGRPSADVGTVQAARSAWPPHALAAGVEFHDEMVTLMRMGPQPRRPAQASQPQPQAATQDGGTSIRRIQAIRSPGSRRAQLFEVEFVDQDGRSYRRRYPVEQRAFAADYQSYDVESDSPALETYGYSPRRSRRSGRGYHRWRW